VKRMGDPFVPLRRFIRVSEVDQAGKRLSPGES